MAAEDVLRFVVEPAPELRSPYASRSEPRWGILTTDRGLRRLLSWRRRLDRPSRRVVLLVDGVRLFEGLVTTDRASLTNVVPYDVARGHRVFVGFAPDDLRDPRLRATLLRRDARDGLTALLADAAQSEWATVHRKRFDHWGALRLALNEAAQVARVDADRLVALIHDDRPAVQRLGLLALAARGVGPDAEALRSHLASEHAPTAVAAAAWLALAGERAGVDALRRTLRGEAAWLDEDVAALALAVLGDVDALDALRARRSTGHVGLAIEVLEAVRRARPVGPY